MTLTPPKKIVWILSLILAIISLALYLVGHGTIGLRIDTPLVKAVAPYSFWIMGFAWLLLLVGVKTKNL